jgi:hypothetical protein
VAPPRLSSGGGEAARSAGSREKRTCTAADGVSLGDAKGSLGDAKGSLGDAKSSLGDAKSSLGDAKSSLAASSAATGNHCAGACSKRPLFLFRK